MEERNRSNPRQVLSRRELLGSAAAPAALTVVPSHVLSGGLRPGGRPGGPGGGRGGRGPSRGGDRRY